MVLILGGRRNKQNNLAEAKYLCVIVSVCELSHCDYHNEFLSHRLQIRVFCTVYFNTQESVSVRIVEVYVG